MTQPTTTTQDSPRQSRQGSGRSWNRVPPVGARWLRVLALSVGGAMVFELVLPRAWAYAKGLQLEYSPSFVAVTTWVSSLVLFYVVSEPVRLRGRQWRYLLLYPPTWLAVPVAWALAAASESLAVGLRPQLTGPDWRHAFPVLPIAAALVDMKPTPKPLVERSSRASTAISPPAKAIVQPRESL